MARAIIMRCIELQSQHKLIWGSQLKNIVAHQIDKLDGPLSLQLRKLWILMNLFCSRATSEKKSLTPMGFFWCFLKKWLLSTEDIGICRKKINSNWLGSFFVDGRWTLSTEHFDIPLKNLSPLKYSFYWSLSVNFWHIKVSGDVWFIPLHSDLRQSLHLCPVGLCHCRDNDIQLQGKNILLSKPCWDTYWHNFWNKNRFYGGNCQSLGENTVISFSL